MIVMMTKLTWAFATLNLFNRDELRVKTIPAVKTKDSFIPNTDC